jgi:hypothetical protein
MKTLAELQTTLQILKGEGNTDPQSSSTTTTGAPTPTGTTTAGVFKGDDGLIYFRDTDDNQTELQTVQTNTGFSRFVFDVDGAFPLVADSVKDSVKFRAENGASVTSDPTTDSLVFSLDPTQLFSSSLTNAGNGGLINSNGILRKLIAGDMTTITTTEFDLRVDVVTNFQDSGAGLTLLAPKPIGNPDPHFRTVKTEGNMTVSSTTNEEISFKYTPVMTHMGSGEQLGHIDGETITLSTLAGSTNIDIQRDALTNKLTFVHLLNYHQSSIGFQLIYEKIPNVQWAAKTLKEGDNVVIQDQGEELSLSAKTKLVNVGAGVPLTRNVGTQGEVLSILPSTGIQASISPSTNEVELSSSVRKTDWGGGHDLGVVEPNGNLKLRTIQDDGATTEITQLTTGEIQIKALQKDIVISGRFVNDYELELTTQEGLAINVGPVPYVHAVQVGTDINIYNRSAFVGRIPAGTNDPFYLDVTGDYGTGGVAGAWDYSEDWSNPKDSFRHDDLNI